MSATLWVVLVAALLLLGVGIYRRARGHTYYTVPFLVIGLLLSSIVLIATPWSDSDDGRMVAATPSPTASANSCPAAFVQKDQTDPKLARFIKGGVDAKTAIESSEKILDAAGHNAEYLFLLANDTFNLDTPVVEKLEDGNCLTKAGQQAHHDLTVLMTASGQEFAEAPADAYNTGINEDGKVVVDEVPGIRGNRKAVKYTLSDGTVVYILVRCGNPVYDEDDKPRRYPPGRTDNPKPPPPRKCPWPLVNGKCLQPKDPSEDVSQNDDVADWKKDGDDRHSVDEDADGASDPRGRQDDPEGDAEEAEEEAEEETEEREEEHEEESSDDTQVDDNQENSEDEDPEW